jgi:hypothetical protein
VLFKIDVQPFASCCPGVQHGLADDRCGYPAPLVITADLRIQEKSMIVPVPGHIDKADQGAVIQASRDPAQAVRPNLIPPAGYSAATMCLDERHHFRVRDGCAPAVLDRPGPVQVPPFLPNPAGFGQDSRLGGRLDCFSHPRDKVGPLAVAGDLHTLEAAVELDVDIKVTGVLVEVQERLGSPREITALALPQLRDPAQLH